MTEKMWITPPTGLKVRHVGLLDLGLFYIWLKRWLDFAGYWKDENEKFYCENVLPTGAKNLDARWEATKLKSKYFTYHIEINIKVTAMSDVEIQSENKKYKVQKGDFELRIFGYLEKGMKASSVLRRIYERFMIRSRLEDHQRELYETTYDLQESIKEYFEQYVV